MAKRLIFLIVIFVFGIDSYAQIDHNNGVEAKERLKQEFHSCYKASYEVDEFMACEYADPCMNIPGNSSTRGMSLCFQQETELWDTYLNQEYKSLMIHARNQDELMPESQRWDGYSRASSLLAAQRAWLKYRDADCNDMYWSRHPGTIKQVVTSSCRMRHTKERTIKLRFENFRYEN